MGFVVEPDLIRITHEDYPGLEVVASSCSLGELDGLQKATRGIDVTALKPGHPDVDRAYDVTDKALRMFLEHVQSWNLEQPAGVPVPVTMDGLLSLKIPKLPLLLLAAWQEGMGEVDAPLGQPLPTGDILPAVPIPMAPLSKSRAS